MDEEEEFDDEDRLLQQELSQHIINEQDLLSIDDQSSVEDVMNQFNKEIEQHESDSEDMPQLEKLPSWSELLKTISVPVLQLDMKESLEYHQLQNTTSSGLENIKDVDAVNQSNIGETTRLITHNSADIIPTQSTEMLFAQSFGDLLPSTKIEHDTIKDNTQNIAVLDKVNITKSNGDAYSGLNSVLAVDDPTTIDLSDIKPIESINNEKNEFTINLAEEITETNQLSQETPQIDTIQNDISNNIGKEETNTNHEVQPNLDASVFENLTQKVSDVKSRGSVKSQKSPQIEKLDLERTKNSGPKTPKAKLSRQTSKLKNVTSLPDLSAIPNEHVRKESQTTKAPLAALLSDDSIFSTENNELAEKTKERKKSITSARRLVNSKLAIESIDEELEKEMSENEKAAIDIAPIKVENEKSNVEGKLIGVNHDRDLIIDKEHLKPKGQLVKGIAIAKRTRVGSVATTDREINYEHQLLLQGQKLTSEGFDSDLDDLSGSESDESRQSSAKSHRGSIKQMAERKLRRQSTTYARLEKKHIDDMDLEKLLQ
ncbi:hypothetical protein HDV02_002887 [Globomyces sp. JEL0801]|nr:hypothetical protein HDV02_002887 [Globomyces sp. JEL0801]